MQPCGPLPFLLLAHMVARFFPDHPPLQRIAAVAMAGLYPAWLAMSGYAYATPAIVLVFMLSVAGAMRVDVHRPSSVVPYSLAVGFLCWVHPTGLAVAVASTLCTRHLQYRGPALRRSRDSPRPGEPPDLHLPSGSRSMVASVGTPSGFPVQGDYPVYSLLLSRLAIPAFWRAAAVAALGQVSYLAVGSLGLAVLGFAKFVRLASGYSQLPASEGACRNRAIRFTSLFVLLSIAGMHLLGSAGFAANVVAAGAPTRVDQWIFGRYAEGTLLPFLAIGWLAASQRRWLPLLAAGLVVSGGMLTPVRQPLRSATPSLTRPPSGRSTCFRHPISSSGWLWERLACSCFRLPDRRLPESAQLSCCCLVSTLSRQ